MYWRGVVGEEIYIVDLALQMPCQPGPMLEVSPRFLASRDPASPFTFGLTYQSRLVTSRPSSTYLEHDRI